MAAGTELRNRNRQVSEKIGLVFPFAAGGSGSGQSVEALWEIRRFPRVFKVGGQSKNTALPLSVSFWALMKFYGLSKTASFSYKVQPP